MYLRQQIGFGDAISLVSMSHRTPLYHCIGIITSLYDAVYYIDMGAI